MIIKFSNAEEAILFLFVNARKGDSIKWRHIRNIQSMGALIRPEEYEAACQTLIRQGLFKLHMDDVVLTERGANIIYALHYTKFHDTEFNPYFEECLLQL